jgi:hypothetical protein
MKEGPLKSHYRNGMIAGSIIALAGSIFTSLCFKPGLLSLPWLIAWYVVSLLVGGGAGFVGGFLASLIPVRLSAVVSYSAGALFGAVGFYWQVYLFLLYGFRNNPTLF